MSRRQVWVEAIVQALGRVMLNLFVVGCFLRIDALGRRKCQVIPELKIPWSVGSGVN